MMKWPIENPINYPRRWFLLLMDSVVMPLGVLVLITGMMLASFSVGTPNGDMLGRALLLFAGLSIVGELFLFRFGMMDDPKGYLLRLIFGGLGSAIAVVVTVIISVTDLPDTLLYYWWPLYLPGVYLLAKALGETHLASASRLFFSPLTFMIISYAGLAFFSLALPLVQHVELYTAQLVNAPTLEELIRRLARIGVEAIPAFWAATTIFALYFLMRRAELNRITVRLLHQIHDVLSRARDWRPMLPTVCALVQEGLGFEKVFIVRPDDEYFEAMERRRPQPHGATPPGAKLRVVAASGRGSEVALEREYSITKGSGREVFISLEGKIVPDVDRDPESINLDVRDIGSKLIMPVLDRERKDIVRALIFVMARRKNRFSQADLKLMKVIAHYISTNAQEVEFGYWDIQEELRTIADAPDFSNMITKVIELAQELFHTRYVGFVPLGLGTGMPLSDAVEIAPKAFRNPDFFRGKKALDPKGRLGTVIRDWNPYFGWTERIKGKDDAWVEWAEQEGIEGWVFAPVGSPEHKVGVLVLAFDDIRGDFNPSLSHHFAQAIGALLQVARYYEQLHLGFLHPAIEVHTIMTRENLSKDPVRGRIKELEREVEESKRNGEDTGPHKKLHEEFKRELELLRKIDRVLYRVRVANELSNPKLNEKRLEEAIDAFWAERLSERPDTRLFSNFDWKVEEESFDLKVMLYRFVTEAIMNALVHGKAKKIEYWLKLQKDPSEIQIIVQDNGEGFQVNSLNDESDDIQPGSIRQLERELMKYAGSSKIEWSCEPGETRLEVTIPVFPMEDGEYGTSEDSVDAETEGKEVEQGEE